MEFIIIIIIIIIYMSHMFYETLCFSRTAQALVTLATKCQVLTRCMNVSCRSRTSKKYFFTVSCLFSEY
jgi:hypothetical protein